MLDIKRNQNFSLRVGHCLRFKIFFDGLPSSDWIFALADNPNRICYAGFFKDLTTF